MSLRDELLEDAALALCEATSCLMVLSDLGGKVNADEIMHALRLTAMGRIGTPEQQRLCEALAALFAEPKQVMSSFSGEALRNHGTPIDGPVQVYESLPKRTRKAKAD